MTDHSAGSDRAAVWRNSIYDQLHAIAEQKLVREKPGHSLQPTLLANDAIMRLLEQENIDPEDKSQVLAAGAKIIRRLLVDYARSRKAEKRGGAVGRGEALELDDVVLDSAKKIDVIELNDALDNLEVKSPRAARVVELKFFGGFKIDEIASQLDVSIATVNNDWRFARAWLGKALGVSSGEGE